MMLLTYTKFRDLDSTCSVIETVLFSRFMHKIYAIHGCIYLPDDLLHLCEILEFEIQRNSHLNIELGLGCKFTWLVNS